MSSLEITKKWIADFIIKLNICPFAKQVYLDEKIGFFNITIAEGWEKLVEEIFMDLNKTDAEHVETAFLLFGQNEISFEDLMWFKDGIDAFLEETNLEEKFQTVIFHPNFVYEGLEENAVPNFVNRSPLPMIHILRNSSMNAISNLEIISQGISEENNITLLNIGEQTLIKNLNELRRKN